MNELQLLARLGEFDLRLERLEREVGILPARAVETATPEDFKTLEALAIPATAADSPGEALQPVPAAPVELPPAPAADAVSMMAHLLDYHKRIYERPPTPTTLGVPSAAADTLPLARILNEASSSPIPVIADADSAPRPVAGAGDPLAENRGVATAPSPVSRSTASDSSIEQVLGLKWTGWIGAVVLLIGVALGIRFMYVNGWFGHVPDSVRLMSIALVGFGLIGLGEWAFRRIDIVPAASLFGAGIATLFLASYTGYAYFHLYDPGAAFFLMGVATVIGALIARRGDMISIGVLSILGGNIAPIILHTDHPSLSGLLGYLGMLEVVALVLAYTGKHPKWWALRGLSLATTGAWIAVVVGSGTFTPSQLNTALWFSVLFAVGYQAELIASSIRWRGTDGSARGGVALSVLVTAALTVAALYILPGDARAHRIGFVAGEIVVAAGLGLGLRRAGQTLLAQGFGLQAAALLVLLVPIAVSGQAVILGWGVLAILMALVGRRLDLFSSRLMAVAVWVLAVADLLWRVQVMPEGDSIHAAWMTIDGVSLTAGLILAWGLALMGEVVGCVTLPKEEDRAADWMPLALFVSIAAAGVWTGVSMQELPALGATLAIISLAWVLTAGDLIHSRMRFAAQAVVLLAMAAVKWVAVDALQERMSPNWLAMQHRPILNPLMGVALLLAISFPAICAIRRKSLVKALESVGAGASAESLRFALSCFVIGLLTIAFSFQIDLVIQRAIASGASFTWPAGQTEQLGLTLLWTLAVAALWVAEAWSYSGEQPIARSRGIGGLGLIMITKFILVDTLLWLPLDLTAMVGFNFYVAVAAVVAVVVLGMSMISLRPQLNIDRPAPGAIAVTLLMVSWTGSFELYRAVGKGIVPGGGLWPAGQLVLLLLTAWWTCGFLALYLLAQHARGTEAQIRRYCKAAAWGVKLLAIKFVVLDTLFWFPGDLSATIGFNLYVGTAFVVSSAVLWMSMMSSGARPDFGWPTPGALATALGTLCVAGSFEIERAVRKGIAPGGHALPGFQLLLLLLTAWWSVGAIVMYLLAPKTRAVESHISFWRNAAASALILLAIKYLIADSLAFWLSAGPAPSMVLFNPQAMAGAVVIAMMAILWSPRQKAAATGIASLAGILMMITGLAVGTLEIDRLFAHGLTAVQFADREFAALVCISIFWSVFAVMAVVFGFRLPAAMLRYFGLALLGITLLKITIVDVSRLKDSYRFMSFIGLGALLMFTSVLYGKFRPRLLGNTAVPADHEIATGENAM